MKKTLKTFGIHFSTAAILLGITLLIEDYDGGDQRQSLFMVMMGGALLSIGGYNYLENRKGILLMIVGIIVAGTALFTFSF